VNGAGIAHMFGDYVVQSDWMANQKTSEHLPAAAHAVTYAACFLPLTRSWRALAVIGGTHFVIDRWRLARHVCWAKNQATPSAYRYPWSEGSKTGYRDDKPPWMSVWLMIAADNAMHLAINRWALEHLAGEGL
jgi:hypothetical protein